MASQHRLKNSLVWIDDKGIITQNYQKVHLFDVEIKDGPILQESK
jgi:predicted amidohydrolase